jgi:glycerol kinase
MIEPTILAMDLGTTGNRVLAFNAQGRVSAQAYREFPQLYPKPGWVEHDPMTIWESSLACLRNVADQIDIQSVQAIGLTNQRETVVIWERATGKPVHPAIVWQCRRTTEACLALKEHEPMLREKTGLLLDPYFSATKISWLLDHLPQGHQHAASGDWCFGTIDTWALWNLTNGRVHATDVSNASRTLLFNIHTQDWDPELLRLFKIPKALLPKIQASDAQFGLLDKAWLGKEIPITGVLGDQQASLFAHGGWRRGVIKATFGTGIFLMAGTGAAKPVVPGLLTTTAWQRADEAHTALEGSIFMGGATLQWLRDNLGILTHARESEAMAQSLPGNQGVYFVPALQGLGAPHWDPQARGLIAGLSRQSSRAHIVRAALEAQAYQTREVVDLMLPALGNAQLLRVDGGASANSFMMQHLADQLGIPVERPEILETTALGAAAMAGMSVGLWTPESFLSMEGVSHTYHPRATRQEADALFKRWQQAVTRAQHWESATS